MKILEVGYWEQFGILSYDKLNELLEFYRNTLSLGFRDLEIYEIHHMVPKSFNKEECNKKYNLILLTPREHYYVHKLLCLCLSGEYRIKMIYALKFMSNCGVDYEITEKEYEINRKIFYENIDISGSNNPFYGREHSDFSRNKMSVTHSGGKFINDGNHEIYVKDEEDIKYYLSAGYSIGRISSSIRGRVCINNGVFHKYVNKNDVKYYLNNGWVRGYIDNRVKLVSDKLSGRKLSDSHKRNISYSMLGDSNPFYGKKHSEESRKKMSESSKGQIVWQKNILVHDDNTNQSFVIKARDICNKYGISYSDIKEIIDTNNSLAGIRLSSVK